MSEQFVETPDVPKQVTEVINEVHQETQQADATDQYIHHHDQPRQQSQQRQDAMIDLLEAGLLKQVTTPDPYEHQQKPQQSTISTYLRLLVSPLRRFGICLW